MYFYESRLATPSTIDINIVSGGSSSSVLNSNSATNNGGLFYIFTATSLTLSAYATYLNSNTASQNGGLMYIDSNGLSTTTFSNN